MLAEIIGHVAADFLLPELGPGFGDHEVAAALVAVPEAAVHEDHSPVPGQHEVGPAGQVLAMQAVTQPVSVQVLADEQLGLGVLAPDAGHVVAAGGRGVDVGHTVAYNADRKRKVQDRSVHLLPWNLGS